MSLISKSLYLLSPYLADLSDEMGMHSTTAEMERNIERENLRKEKEEADLRLIEEQEEKAREEAEKAMHERREKSSKEKKEREERRRVERRVESERRERDGKKRLSQDNDKILELENLSREQNVKWEKENGEMESREKENKEEESREEKNGEEATVQDLEGAERERLMKVESDTRSADDSEGTTPEPVSNKGQRRISSAGEMQRQINEFDSKLFAGSDRKGLDASERKVREEIERKIRVENIRCRNDESRREKMDDGEVKSSEDDYERERERERERRIRDDICVRASDENDESSPGFRRPSILEADKFLSDNDRILRLANESNMELESERKKRVENERRLQDETDRKIREENEKRIRGEIERNILEENERKLHEENERKIQEEVERKSNLEKKKRIAARNELRKTEELERKLKAEEERKSRIEAEWRIREESASRAKIIRDQKIKEDNLMIIELERRKSFEIVKKENEQIILDRDRRKSYESKSSTSSTPIGSRAGSRRMSGEDMSSAAKGILKSENSRKSPFGDTDDCMLDPKLLMHKRPTPRTSITVPSDFQHRDSRADGAATSPVTTCPPVARLSRPSSAVPMGPRAWTPTSNAEDEISRAGVAFDREKQQQLQQIPSPQRQQQQQQQQRQASPNNVLVAEILDAKDRQLPKTTAFQLSSSSSSSDAARRSSILQQAQPHSDPIILTLLTIDSSDKEAESDGRLASPGSLPDARKALKSLSESELSLSVKY